MKTNNKNINFSTKVSLLSFVLCCGVVSQHVKWTYRECEWLNDLQAFWFFIVETCVPFFFIISGYLFFRTYSVDKSKAKLHSRVRTLFVPYIIWNVLYTSAMLALHHFGIVSNMNSTDSIVGGVKSCLNSDLSTLWFVKYLMAFVCVSPFLYFVLRKKILGFAAIVFLLAVNAYNYYSGTMQIPLNVNANNVVMFIYQYSFFAIGSYFALCWKNMVEVANRIKGYCGIGMLLSLILCYLLIIVHRGDVITNHTFRLLWCIALWLACDLLPEIRIRPWMKYSFFIYCSHYLFVLCAQGVTNIFYCRAGTLKPALQIIEYIWMPLFTIFVLIKTGNFLKMHVPYIWGVITGSRG